MFQNASKQEILSTLSLVAVRAGSRVSCRRKNDKSAHTSKKTNKSTVLGPRRMNAGVHPLNKNMGPSFCNDRRKTSRGLALPDCGID